MKKTLLLYVLLICTIMLLSACNSPFHSHKFDEWITTQNATCVKEGTNTRYCICGEFQTQSVPPIEHTIIIDEEILPTCDKDGKTEGKHCDYCNTIFVEQIPIQALGHKYDNGQIILSATCVQDGLIKYTCSVANCNHSYTEYYTLPTYTPTEIFNQSIKYVGEIVTYDKNSSPLSLGSCFVISSDGRLLTNYHVIDGAYSASVTINDAKYTVTSVIGYNPNIDLAILKINATGLTPATICKIPDNVGTTVYAIGSSRGMTNTYSQGIITYKSRVIDGISYIQHDASITNGNSGGPLINSSGEVIGINTWTISNSQNLNFAISISEVDNLVYRSPASLSDVAETNLPPQIKLAKWLTNNFTSQDSSDQYNTLCYDSWYDAIPFQLCYIPQTEQILVKFSYQQTSFVLSLTYPLPEYMYLLYFTQQSYAENYHILTGNINANTFNKQTQLKNYTYSCGISNDEENFANLAQMSIVTTIKFLSNFFENHPELNLTLNDLEFKSFN